MPILVNAFDRKDQWMRELAHHLPDETLWAWPECPDPSEVEMLVAWRMRRSDMATFTNMTHIFSTGAGTEQWQKDGTPEVTIVRLADPTMRDEMAAYALHWVIHHLRGFDRPFGPDQLDSWGDRETPPPSEYPVGILGYGTIGRRIGAAFSHLGFPVNAWTRSGTDDATVRSFAGLDELPAFLGESRAIVNVLPNTEATRGLLDATRWEQCSPGALFVNVGRGTVVDSEADLLAALDSGTLSAAVLDVTDPEPPAADSPLWTHPRVIVTPHVAGLTQVRSAARIIADNIARVRAGVDPFPIVDRATGY